MGIERMTEGSLQLRATGKGVETAVAKWVVGEGKLVIHQNDSRVILSQEQFAELMRESQDIYADMKGETK